MFSNSTKYAIRTILFLAKTGVHRKCTVEEIATALEIPRPYLSKILQQLSKDHIISSTKGRGGGFYLSEDNFRRPLMDIIICIEGHNVLDNCLLGLPECSENNPCLLHSDYKEFRKNLQRIISEESIKSLLANSRG